MSEFWFLEYISEFCGQSHVGIDPILEYFSNSEPWRRICEIYAGIGNASNPLPASLKVDKEIPPHVHHIEGSPENFLSDPYTLCNEPGPSLKNISALFRSFHQLQLARRTGFYTHSEIAP